VVNAFKAEPCPLASRPEAVCNGGWPILHSRRLRPHDVLSQRPPHLRRMGRVELNRAFTDRAEWRPKPPSESTHMSVIIDRALGYRWTSRTSVDESSLDRTDLQMMVRCLDLARAATQAGEFPFAAVISKNGEIVAETINQVARDADITRHAELIAVSAAQKVLARGNLKNCTLYTIVEPCPMCSFAIREARIDRVVFALSSPLMGGSSRWNVLGDDVLSLHMPEVFAPPPDIVAGLLSKEAAQVWRRWNPIIWGIIRLRGVFRPSDTRSGRAK